MSRVPDSQPVVILVKHAQPVLDSSLPPREWRLARDGERQAHRLADALRQYLPFRMFSSPELKARQTSEIVAAELGVAMTTVEDLRELDRPPLPILSESDHRALNARVFAEPDVPVIGAESAASALQRFERALGKEIDPAATNLVVIAHGTVISLFVASVDPSVEAFVLWKRLRCPSFVVLDGGSLALREIVDELQDSE